MVLMTTSADLSLFIIFKLVQESGHQFSLRRNTMPYFILIEKKMLTSFELTEDWPKVQVLSKDKKQ